jgi:pSer/pThr/pTyr-binding forkhead associated (FHA) protein
MADDPENRSPLEEKTELYRDESLDNSSYPCLQLINGPSRGARYSLRTGKNLIGRSYLADVSLDDLSISREHTEIDVHEEEGIVQDLGSRNGTKVRGRPIDGATPMLHGERLSVGNYHFQFFTGPGELMSEEALLAAEAEASEAREDEPLIDEPSDIVKEPSDDQASHDAEGPESEETAPDTEQEEKREDKKSAQDEDEQAAHDESDEDHEGGDEMKQLSAGRQVFWKRKPVIMGAAGAFVIILAVTAWFLGSDSSGDKKNLGKSTGEVIETDSKDESLAYTPIFLDFSSTPLRADVYFGESFVGRTPFRMNTRLQYGQVYEVRAFFRLKEAKETVEERLRFSLSPGQEVIPIEFSAPIGHFKIETMPSSVDMQLESFYASDPYRPKTLRFDEIVFRKPIYVPYGRYVLELRQKKQLSSSQTFIDQVVYRREFVVGEQEAVNEVRVSDKDLTFFPAKIESIPSEAEVWIDEQKIGKTPYEGTLPIGDHTIVLRREGYFEYTHPVRMELNTPLELEVALTTSEAGDFINQARLMMRQKLYKEAINKLIDSLTKTSVSLEIAEAQILIGQCYLYLGDYAKARDYYMKAQNEQEFYHQSQLGLAQILIAEDSKVEALQKIGSVLLESNKDHVRSQGAKLFHELSPFASVLYVATEPGGATITVNNKEVAIKSPMMLHDLMVGVYRLQVTKPGYQAETVKVDLGVSEFHPLRIKLKPVAFVP